MHPVVAQLKKHQLKSFFIAAQVAIACAVLSNVAFVMVQLLRPILMTDGLKSNHLIFAQAVASPQGFSRDKLVALSNQVQAIQGVRSISIGQGLPFWPAAPIVQISIQANGNTVSNAYGYIGNRLVETFESRLTSGSDFLASQKAGNISDAFRAGIVLSESLAKRLFSGTPAVGKRVRIKVDNDSTDVQVVGVVDHVIASSAIDSNADASYSFFLPGWPDDANLIDVVVNVDQASRDRVIKVLPKILADSLPDADRNVPAIDASGKQFSVMSASEAKSEYFRNNKSLLLLLSCVVIVVSMITIFGITGLSSAWIRQRRRHVGIRRALGATQSDIVRFFLCENLLLVSLGLIVGVIGAYAFNVWLMKVVECERVPVVYIVISVILLFVVGQCSVFLPAIRMSSRTIASQVA